MSSSSEFDNQNFKPTFKLRLQIVVLVLLVVGNKLVSDSLTFNCNHLAPVQVGDLALLVVVLVSKSHDNISKVRLEVSACKLQLCTGMKQPLWCELGPHTASQ